MCIGISTRFLVHLCTKNGKKNKQTTNSTFCREYFWCITDLFNRLCLISDYICIITDYVSGTIFHSVIVFTEKATDGQYEFASISLDVFQDAGESKASIVSVLTE